MSLIQLDSMITKATTASDGVITIEGYANTVDKDRAGDIILASAWKTRSALTNYQKNPIILFGHDHRRPVGSCIEVRPDEKGLFVAANIVRDTDPQVFSMVEHGILKTFSVGFRCLDADWEDHSDTFVIKDLELHEISVVAVPCNQDSTFQVAKSMNGSDYLDFRKEFINNNAEPVDPFRTLVERIHNAVLNGK